MLTLPLPAALALWAGSLPFADPADMTDLGLLSILPPTFYAAIAVIVLGFGWTLSRRGPHLLLGAYLAGLILIVHGTPALLYDTLRYSWAWKHLGIVDYIQRTGTVDPSIGALDVYHNWPGFFAVNALLNEAAGVDSSLQLATWTPVLVNLLLLGALLFLFSSLTRESRVIWLACGVFFITNWVGQDYFAAQSFVFFLYLVALAIVMRWLRPIDRPRATPLLARLEPLQRGRNRAAARRAVLVGASGPRGEMVARTLVIGLFLVISATIISSHALTGMLLLASVVMLSLGRLMTTRWLALALAAMIVLWSISFSRSFVFENVASTLATVDLPWATAESNFTETSQLTTNQTFVSQVGRGLVVVVVLLAVLGIVRSWRRGRFDPAPIALMVAPLLLLGIGDYDGELIFRIYLFTLPFLALFVGQALEEVPGALRGIPRYLARTARIALVGALVAAFLVAYYGKDGQYYFSPDEVAAAEFVYNQAPEGTLLVEGTRNYPGQARNYERFFYVPISREDPPARREIVADPVSVLSRWLSDDRYPAAYVIITRAQKAEIDQLGGMPPGSLDAIEDALSASPEFVAVFSTEDAKVFTLAERLKGTQP